MSQFNYLNEINNVLSMDSDLTRCQAPRWQKKMDSSSAMNASINTSKLSVSYNNGYSALAASFSGKTPQKMMAGGATKSKKTPNGKSPGNLNFDY